MDDIFYFLLAIWIILEIVLAIWWKHKETDDDIKSDIFGFLGVSCVITPIISVVIAGCADVFIRLFMQFILLFTIAFITLGIILVILYWGYLKAVFNKICIYYKSLKLFIDKKVIKKFRQNGDK